MSGLAGRRPRDELPPVRGPRGHQAEGGAGGQGEEVAGEDVPDGVAGQDCQHLTDLTHQHPTLGPRDSHVSPVSLLYFSSSCLISAS